MTIAVMNFNGEQNLRRFFQSVLAIEYPNREIMVVDGGSRDGSMKFLSQFEEVRFIDQGIVPGSGHAVNVAALEAKGDLILFLGNDMRPNPDILSFLVPMISSDPRFGICCPKILSVPDGRSQEDIIDHVGFRIDRFGFPKPIGLGEHDRGQYDSLTESWFVGGCEALVKREVFEPTGFFDETYFTMVEDIDFCWRLKLQGYRILLEPRGVVYHDRPLEHATTTNRLGRARIRYFAERNYQRTLIKNYSTRTLVSVAPAYLGIFLAQLSAFILMRRLDLFRADVRALVDNIRDFRRIWKQHVRVQSKRKVSDEVILPTMSRRSYKIEILRDVFGSLGASSS